MTARRVELDCTDTAVHERITGRTKADKIASRRGERHVVRHIAGRISGAATANTVDLTRRAGTLAAAPAKSKERGKLTTLNQGRTLLVYRRQATPHPVTDGVFMDIQQPGGFFH